MGNQFVDIRAEQIGRLVTELKRACGAGGAAGENTVEIQGDLRDRVRQALEKKGWTVKG